MERSAVRRLTDLLSRPDGAWALSEAALAVARMGRPGLDERPSLDEIDAIAARARARIGDAEHPRFVAGSLARSLFDGEGFVCERKQPRPEHCYLDRAIETRVAGPELMTLIFLEVARLSRARFGAIGLPGRLLVRRDRAGTPFLFDVARRARPVSLDECRRIVDDASGGRTRFSDGFLRPITPEQLLCRLIARIKDIFWHANRFDDALGAVRLMLTVRPDDPREIRDRGRLLFLLGRLPDAIQAFETYLVHNPRGEDADVVRMLIQEARAGLPPAGS